MHHRAVADKPEVGHTQAARTAVAGDKAAQQRDSLAAVVANKPESAMQCLQRSCRRPVRHGMQHRRRPGCRHARNLCCPWNRGRCSCRERGAGVNGSLGLCERWCWSGRGDWFRSPRRFRFHRG